MKKTILNLSAAAFLFAALFTSCSKDKNVTPAASQAQMGFQLTADNAQTNLGGASVAGRTTSTTAVSLNTSIKWTSIIASVSRFKLEAKKDGKELEVQTKNVSNLDLLNLNTAPITALVDTGLYREIEVKILLLKSSGTDIPLTAKGTFTTSGGIEVPIEFDYNDNAIIKAEVENVRVDATTDVTTKISLHLNKLLTGIPAATIEAAARTNGAIVISSTSNANIYNKVIANILLSFEAHNFEHHQRGK